MHRAGNSSLSGSRQAGLTLIEFMVSIVIGMLMIAALAVLIANQSTTRTDIDKSGRTIENGRYAVQTMRDDIQMAGYWGELTNQPAPPGALPDPCSVTVAPFSSAIGRNSNVVFRKFFSASVLNATEAAFLNMSR